MVYRYIADYHLFDVNSLYWREYELDDYANMCIDTCNYTCSDSDILIIAGDIGTECRYTIDAYNRIKCQKILVMGNHDYEWSTDGLNKCFRSVVKTLHYGNINVVHVPTQSGSRSDYLIHGHHHEYSSQGMQKARAEYIRDRMRYNCCADLNKNKPCTLLELQVNKEQLTEQTY